MPNTPATIPTAQTTIPDPLLLSAASVAKLLDTTPLVVRRLARSGRFPQPIRTHRKLARWHRTAVLNWIESSAAAAPNRRRIPGR